MADKTENKVVGRKTQAKVPTQTPTPTPKPTPNPSVTSITDRINGRLREQEVVITGTDTMDTTADFLATLNRKQKLEIAGLLKGNFTIRQLSDVDTILAQNFSMLPVAKDYKDFISNLKAELIPSGAGADNLPTQQITQVSPESKKKTAEAAWSSVYGKKPTDVELKQANEFLQKMIDVGQTTTTKVVGGKKVITYTPGYSEARGQLALEEKLRQDTSPMAQQDLLEKQSIDALDKIVKWGG